MNFLIYNESGAIEQSNKLYAWEKGVAGRKQDHSDLLNDMGQTHIAVQANEPLHTGRWFVNSDLEPQKRKPMPISVSATRIRAGENYASILTGIPKGAAITVRARGFVEPLINVTVSDGRLEISVPTPGLYQIDATKFPHIDWRANLEVTS